MERGCSDREGSAESRRRSRSASRGRFAESWKRLSSKQGSTKRSGLPAQQTPVSWGESGPQHPSFGGARNLVRGAELALLALEPENLWSHLQGKCWAIASRGPQGTPPFSLARRGSFGVSSFCAGMGIKSLCSRSWRDRVWRGHCTYSVCTLWCKKVVTACTP